MKKITNFFGTPLTILFTIFLLLFCIILFEMSTDINLFSPLFGVNTGPIMGAITTVIFLLIFGVGVVYLVIGIVVFIFRVRKNPSEKGFAKKMVLRGLLGMAISLVGFFLVSFALSFFGITLTGSTLPRIPQATGEKFPMQDLQVITAATGSDSAHLKYYQEANDAPFSSRSAESPGNCDIIIKNTNSELMAGDITLYSSKTNSLYHISPDYISSNGLTFAWIITDYTSDDCSEFTLQSANVYK